jgi:hypothetical protein
MRSSVLVTVGKTKGKGVAIASVGVIRRFCLCSVPVFGAIGSYFSAMARGAVRQDGSCPKRVGAFLESLFLGSSALGYDGRSSFLGQASVPESPLCH